MDADVVSGGNQEFVVMKRALIWVGKAIVLAVLGIAGIVFGGSSRPVCDRGASVCAPGRVLQTKRA